MMNESANKNNMMCLRVFLECCILFIIGISPYLILSGGVYAAYGDYNVQIIPFWFHIYDMYHSGLPAWDWQSDLGMNFPGSYAFYGLTSPYTLLSLLSPRSALPYVMVLINAAKFGVTGTGAYIYCRAHTKKDISAHICGLLYAFSGVHIFNMVFHFQDVISFFPLLLHSFDGLVKENRRCGFALMLAVTGFTNYYFFFGECVFLLIYFIVKAVCGDFVIDKKTFARTAFETASGIALTAVILLPSYFVLRGNSRGGQSVFKNSLLSYAEPQTLWKIVYSAFFIPDLCRQPGIFSGDSADIGSVSLYIPLFSVIGTAVMIRSGRKKWYVRMLAVCAAAAAFPLTNSIFSALNAHYYARWFYMPLLIMTMMTGKYLDDFETHDIRNDVKCLFGIYAFFLVSGANVIMRSPSKEYIAAALAFSALSTLVVYVMRYVRRELFAKHILKITAVFCCIPLLFSAVYMESLNLWQQTKQAIDKTYNDFYPLSIDDSGFFRTVNADSSGTNFTLMYGYPSVNMYHSLVTGNESEFYAYTGEYRESGGNDDQKNYAVHTFLSAKYDVYFNKLLVGGTEVDPENIPYSRFGFERTDVQNRYVIYENTNYIPMGFTYDYYLDIGDFEKHDSAYLKANEDKDEAYRREKLLLKAIWLTEEQIGRYGDILSELPDELAEDTSDEAYVKDCIDRRNSAAYEFIPDGKGFSARIMLERDNLVFWSVPYDKGFGAYVDGEPAEIENVFGGLCAVKVPAGDHSVRFDYTVRGLKGGAAVSAAALILIIAELCMAAGRRSVISYQ